MNALQELISLTQKWAIEQEKKPSLFSSDPSFFQTLSLRVEKKATPPPPKPLPVAPLERKSLLPRKKAPLLAPKAKLAEEPMQNVGVKKKSFSAPEFTELKALFPSVATPDDTLAKKVASQWKREEPCWILLEAASEEERELLKRLAVAMDRSVRPTKLIDREALEKKGSANRVIGSKAAIEALSFQPKSPFRIESLQLLLDKPNAKSELWERLKQLPL